MPFASVITCGSGLEQACDSAKQFFGSVPSLGIEGVGDHAARNAFAGVVSPTDGDHWNLWKAAAQDGEEFETGHVRHVEIGDDDVGRFRFELQQGIKAVLRSGDLVPF